jgi:hypothetical protein
MVDSAARSGHYKTMAPRRAGSVRLALDLATKAIR